MKSLCQDKGFGAAWQQPFSSCVGHACRNETNFKGAVVSSTEWLHTGMFNSGINQSIR